MPIICLNQALKSENKAFFYSSALKIVEKAFIKLGVGLGFGFFGFLVFGCWVGFWVFWVFRVWVLGWVLGFLGF
jgi:hypothetical protein